MTIVVLSDVAKRSRTFSAPSGWRSMTIGLRQIRFDELEEE
jgi:hypothetical protein